MRPPRKSFIVITGVLTILAALVAFATAAHAQGGLIPINYGDTVTGTIKNTKDTDYVVYSFDGSKGDVITLTMTRTSGTLRPYLALGDSAKSGASSIIAQGKTSTDGKSATISNFKIPYNGNFFIVATRDGIDNGTTSGNFKMTLTKSGGGASKQATATPKRSATKTPIPPTDEPPANEDGVQTFDVGSGPFLSIWTGTNLFVSNWVDGTITILDSDGNTVNTIQAGFPCGYMAWDGKRLWVPDLGTADKPGNSIHLYDATGKSVGTFKVGAGPNGISYDADNKRMWVALLFDKKVVSLDTKGKVLSSVDLDFSPISTLWDGTQLWVTTASDQDGANDTLLRIDADSNIASTIEVGKYARQMAFNDTDKVLVLTNRDDNKVMLVDPDGNIAATLKVSKGPRGAVWDGERLWVSLFGENSIVALDGKGKVLKKVSVSASVSNLTYDGTYIWATAYGTADNPGNQVVRIEVSTVMAG
jgi:hypothetical protein